MCILGVYLDATVGKYALPYSLEIGALPGRIGSMGNAARAMAIVETLLGSSVHDNR